MTAQDYQRPKQRPPRPDYKPYAQVDGELYEYFFGERDAAERKLRWLGCLPECIGENPLRILRFFRFHARFAATDPHDADVLRAMAAESPRLRELSGEVIWKAVKQIVQDTPGSVAVELRAMVEYGFLRELLPGGLGDNAHFDVDAALRVRLLQEKASSWTLSGETVSVNPVLTIVELFRRDPAVLQQAASAWNWSCDEAELGVFLCANLGQAAPSLEESRRWLRVPDNFESQMPQISELKRARPRLCLREWLIAQSRFCDLEALQKVELATFPIVAMRKLGLPKSKLKGDYVQVLRRVKQVWVDSNCRLTASELLQLKEPWESDDAVC